MAPSDLWSGELRGVGFGAGSDVIIRRPPGVQGLAGIPQPRRSVTPRLDQGSALGRLSLPERVVSFRLGARGVGVTDTDRQADAHDKLATVADAWWPQTDGAEVELQMLVPWRGGVDTVLSLFGFPAGVDVDAAEWTMGWLEADADFVATDPLVYGAEVAVSADVSSPLTVASSSLGTADTDRVTLTLVGDGGIPTITNDQGGSIVFSQAVANAATVTVDLRERTATLSGSDVTSRISLTSDWLRLVAGQDNELSWTNLTSLAVTYRPAWW